MDDIIARTAQEGISFFLSAREGRSIPEIQPIMKDREKEEKSATTNPDEYEII